ncbi:zinc finger protein [Anaeramoeba ignava]|uniref:Zinc finger protein n=1 Tax=Anaeramoeba ignava TaxID=1746090 RepID=A0A9Q0LN87_ANAIG|nr:zinc finger protein [Anaeramoeba ignava]
MDTTNPNKKESFICTTCLTEFELNQDLLNHYKSEWHRFNLVRKSSSKKPVSLQQFEEDRKVLEQPTQFSRRKIRQLNKREKKHRIKKKIQQHKQKIQSKKNQKQTLEQENEKKSNLNEEDEAKALQKKMDEKIEKKIQQNKKYLSLKNCLFCPKKFDSIQKVLKHMEENHSLIIPDLDHVNDIEELLLFFHEKITIGNYCLFCNKEFKNLNSVRNHMKDLGHSKMNINLANFGEYKKFYDYYDSDDYDDSDYDYEEDDDYYYYENDNENDNENENENDNENDSSN